MRHHRIVAALSVALLIGACSSSGTPTMTDASATVTILSAESEGPAPTMSEVLAQPPLPLAPEITDAGVFDGAMVISIAKPHVREAVEYYQVSVDGSEWRTLDAIEWRPAQGGAGVIVTLREPALEPGQAALVRLRAASLAGFGAESRTVSISTGMTGGSAGLDDSGSVDVDTALGLGSPTEAVRSSNPAQQAIVIIIEVLAALGLVSIGIFIGRRVRRS